MEVRRLFELGEDMLFFEEQLSDRGVDSLGTYSDRVLVARVRKTIALTVVQKAKIAWRTPRLSAHFSCAIPLLRFGLLS